MTALTQLGCDLHINAEVYEISENPIYKHIIHLVLPYRFKLLM